MDYREPKTPENVVSRSSTSRPSTANTKHPLLKFGHSQNAKSCDTAVSTFSFRFVTSPLFSHFLILFFFFCWQFTHFISVGNVFGTVFRVLGFEWKEAKVCSGIRLSSEFSGQPYMAFFLLLRPP